MAIVKKISKISEKKNHKVLNQTLEKKVNYFKEFHIANNTLYVRFDRSKLNHRDAANNLKLPSYKEIEDEAIRVYKNFKMDNIIKICYVFDYITFNGTVSISPDFSDVIFTDCMMSCNLFVSGGNLVEIIDCRWLANNYFKIECRNINIQNTNLRGLKTIDIKSDEINIEDSDLTSINNINLISSIMVFNDSKLEGQNINLESDLIDTENTMFKSENVFDIKCGYNEKVKVIDAKRVVYNGVDITNTDSIKRPQLLKKLIEDLKKIKDFVDNDIKSDIEEIVRIRRESLEEKPITKILNKNNR